MALLRYLRFVPGLFRIGAPGQLAVGAMTPPALLGLRPPKVARGGSLVPTMILGEYASSAELWGVVVLLKPGVAPMKLSQRSLLNSGCFTS